MYLHCTDILGTASLLPNLVEMDCWAFKVGELGYTGRYEHRAFLSCFCSKPGSKAIIY